MNLSSAMSGLAQFTDEHTGLLWVAGFVLIALGLLVGYAEATMPAGRAPRLATVMRWARNALVMSAVVPLALVIAPVIPHGPGPALG